MDPPCMQGSPEPEACSAAFGVHMQDDQVIVVPFSRAAARRRQAVPPGPGPLRWQRLCTRLVNAAWPAQLARIGDKGTDMK